MLLFLTTQGFDESILYSRRKYLTFINNVNAIYQLWILHTNFKYIR